MIVLVIDNKMNPMVHLLEHYHRDLKMGVVVALVGNRKQRSGVGKSYTAMRIGELVDEDFSNGTEGMNKIIFTPADFLRTMKYVEAKGTHGQVIIIDEAGILINSRQWFSMINKAMGDIMMTLRTLRCVVIFVLPALPVMDKTVRMFVNFQGKMEKVMQGHSPIVRMKFYQMMWDDNDLSKYQLKKIVMYNRDLKKKIHFTSFIIKKPQNKELLRAYEKKAGEYKKEIRESIAALGGDRSDFDADVDEVLKNPKLITTTAAGRRKVSAGDIEIFYNKPKAEASLIAKMANRRLMEGEGGK